MKLPAVLIGVLAGMTTLSALANGPMPASGSMPSNGVDTTPRQKWTRKRIRYLKNRMGEDAKAQRTADGIDLAMGNIPNRSGAAKRQMMINRFEFLALKKERRGSLSAKETAEMYYLQHSLLGW